MMINFYIEKEDAGNRIDKYLTEKNPQFSRAYIQKLLELGEITVNDKIIKSNYKTRENDNILINISEPTALDIVPENIPLDIVPENIPLDIVYEDSDIIIVNKPKGMVVHPAAGHNTGTLVNALLYHCKDNLSSINGVLRPGIVHRIDKDTTGLLVVCKNDIAHRSLATQLQNHTITRKYHAIVYHNIAEEKGTINKAIGRNKNDRKKMAIDLVSGREAITHYEVIKRLQSKYTYVECRLETGRTHQIRVHMASINHALLGDTVYGQKTSSFKNLVGQTLHAKTLGFVHPRTNDYIEFDSLLPDYFESLLENLR